MRQLPRGTGSMTPEKQAVYKTWIKTPNGVVEVRGVANAVEWIKLIAEEFLARRTETENDA